MAGIIGIAQTAEIAHAGGDAAKTLLQLVAAANHRVLVIEWSVSFNGIDNTAEPIKVSLARQTTAGTSSALTPEKMNEGDDETLQTTARHTATVEPTTGNSIAREKVHPQGGFTWQAPPGGKIVIKGGNRLGWIITAPAAIAVELRAVFEE